MRHILMYATNASKVKHPNVCKTFQGVVLISTYATIANYCNIFIETFSTF